MAETTTLANAVPRDTAIIIDFDQPGETRTTWGAFVDDNTAPGVDMDEGELAAIERAVRLGLVYRLGGGAAAEFTIERA